jgi:hypothetical protein
METIKKPRKPRTKKLKALGQIEVPQMWGVATFHTKLNYFPMLDEKSDPGIFADGEIHEVGPEVVQFAFTRDGKIGLEEDARRHWNKLNDPSK